MQRKGGKLDNSILQYNRSTLRIDRDLFLLPASACSTLLRLLCPAFGVFLTLVGLMHENYITAISANRPAAGKILLAFRFLEDAFDEDAPSELGCTVKKPSRRPCCFCAIPVFNLSAPLRTLSSLCKHQSASRRQTRSPANAMITRRT